MTSEDIIRMAREAGFRDTTTPVVALGVSWEQVQCFAALVAKHEREECAKVCDELKPFGPHLYIQKATAQDCAAAIRARGNK